MIGDRQAEAIADTMLSATSGLGVKAGTYRHRDPLSRRGKWESSTDPARLPHVTVISATTAGLCVLEMCQRGQCTAVQTRTVQLLAEGYSQSDIARLRGVSRQAVHNQVMRIRGKMVGLTSGEATS